MTSYMLDTAGRLSIDEELMQQSKRYACRNPREKTLLVVDGLTSRRRYKLPKTFKQPHCIPASC